MKKTVLVTGGAGYIGSHTAVELINAGYQVVIVDNLSNSEASAVENIKKITGTEVKFYELDCLDSNNFDKVFKENNIDAVIHFAAAKAVGDSVKTPLHYYHNNLGSLITLMELMRENGTQNLVFSSSCTVYGQPEQLPVTEDTPFAKPTSPYGNTKNVCEKIIEDSTHAYDNVKAISLRYFNPIGAHTSALIGELPIGVPSNLLPFITQTTAGLRDCLSVFGDDYNTPDGTPIRDYIDVIDLAKVHVVAVTRLIEGKNKKSCEAFNVGTGAGRSVLELINLFEKATGKKVPYKIVPRREGDIEKIWADSSYTENELGWKAERDIEDTLRAAWNWEKQLRGIKE